MAFTGNLSTFSVLNLLRAVRLEALTGILTLECEQGIKQLLYRDGGLVSIVSSQNRRPLGQVLIGMRRLLPEDLEDLLEAQKKSKDRLGRIMLERDMIEEAVLNEAVALQMEDTLLEILGWQEGQYSFSEAQFPAEDLVELGPRATAWLEEGLERAAELKEARARIPDFESYLRRTEASKRKGLGITPEQRYLLIRADGQTRVAELFAPELGGAFQVYVDVGRLKAQELLELGEEPMEVEDLAEEQTRELLLDIMRGVADLARQERAFQRVMRSRMEGLLPMLTRDMPAEEAPEPQSGLEREIRADSAPGTSAQEDAPAGESGAPIFAAPPPQSGEGAGSIKDLEDPDAPAEEPALEETATGPVGEKVQQEPAEEPAEELADAGPQMQMVSGTEGDAFPWFQPGDGEAAEPEPVAPGTDELDDSLLDSSVEVEAPADLEDTFAGDSAELKLDFDLPGLDDLGTGAEGGEEGAPKEEPDEDLEMFEDRVARKVRYNKLRSSIKMAYNRLRLRKPSLFEVLEVPPHASPKQVQRAYRKLKKQFETEGVLKSRDREHLNMAQEIHAKLDEAYAVLSDAKRRRDYVREMKRARKRVGEKKQEALKLFHAGMAAYNEDDYEKAERLFKQAMEVDPNNPVFYDMIDSISKERKAGESTKYYRAGLIAWKQKNDPARATLLLRKAIQIAPKQSAYHLALGQVLATQRENFDEALKELAIAQEKDPGNVELHSTVAGILMKMGRLQEAADRYAEVLHWDERNRDAAEALKVLKEKKITPKFKGRRKRGRS